jgi:hypothetical protein
MATAVPVKIYNPKNNERIDAVINPFYVLYIFQISIEGQQATGIRLLNDTLFVLDADVSGETLASLFGA